MRARACLTSAWPLVATLAIAVAACAETELLTCFPGACEPGTCEAAQGSAFCACPVGYEPGGTLACLPTLQLGMPCTASGQCQSGWCLHVNDSTSYCSARDCQDHSACDNKNPDDQAEMCCVDVGGELRVCLKLDPGYSCGIQDKTCGQSCQGQGDSACDPDHTCLSGLSSYCSHGCVSDADCIDCAFEGDSERGFQCQSVGSSGSRYCTALPGKDCTASSQCSAGSVCLPLSADGVTLDGFCGRRGDLAAGEACDQDDDQCMGICVNGHCAEMCETDGDCPTQTTCKNVRFCRESEGSGECAMCVSYYNSVLMCLWDETGDQPVGAPCDFGTVHPGEGFCQEGLTCLGIRADDAPCTAETMEADCVESGELRSTWNPMCVPPKCERPGYCGASFCSAACAPDDSCELGFEAVFVGGTDCYCIPGEPPGNQGPGEPCIFGNVHADTDDCQAGLTCLVVTPGSDSQSCQQDSDCTTIQENWNPDCVGGRCGASFCSAPCDATTGACLLGTIAEDVGGDCFCIPPRIGDAEAGEACAMGNVNPEADDCQADLVCLGTSATMASPSCHQDVDCEAVYPANQHPDCANVNNWGRCGYSYCAPRCDGQGACPIGFDPITLEGACYCRPCSPDCAGKECGADGCGGSCGECTLPQVCDPTGQCVDP